MAYATLADLNLAFGEEEITQLSDRDGDDSNDTNVVETKLAEAESEINSYLSVKYELPITSVSSNLKKVTCDIARYLMHKDGATDEVVRHYKEAISWLKDIVAGRAVLLDVSASPVDSVSSSGGVQSFSCDRQFTDTTMVNF